MNKLAHTHSDIDTGFVSGSNGLIAFLLGAIIVAMLLVFVMFDQQSKWWLGGAFNDMYANQSYMMLGSGTFDGLLYLLGIGCAAAVVVGFSLLRGSDSDNDVSRPMAQVASKFDSRIFSGIKPALAASKNETSQGINYGMNRDARPNCADLIPTNHTFDMINPKLCNLLNPTGQGQQSVFIYIDSEIDEINANLWNDIHGYFAHYDKSLRLLAPPQLLSGQSPQSLESQVSRIHQHVVSQHLDKNSQILVIGEGSMVDTVSNVCQQYQSEVKLVRIPYH